MRDDFIAHVMQDWSYDMCPACDMADCKEWHALFDAEQAGREEVSKT